MTIPKSAKEWAIATVSAVVLGVIGNAAWSGITHLAASKHIDPPMIPHINIPGLAQLISYVVVAGIGVFVGKNLGLITEKSEWVDPETQAKSMQSSMFVLEVEGTKPIDSHDSDWKFFLTNCSGKVLRTVELYNIRSEIEAYEIGFHEIPVMQPGQKVQLRHEISARRQDERYSQIKPTLWDFAMCHAGERGNTYIWYDILIKYREADSETEHDDGFVAVCFDLESKILKTEGAEVYRADRIRWGTLSRRS